MTDTLTIGDLQLPLSVATSGVTILGQPDTGKTNLCRLIAEALLAYGVPVVIPDPKGDYWGLRLRRDGKAPSGFNIPIFGGDHGDLELTEESGRVVADAIVDNRSSAILDLSHFESDAARIRFMTAYTKRLYYRKKDAPFPLPHIFDEIDLFAPQRPMREETHMLHALIVLRKMGRKRGIGVIGNAQRSSRIHKDVVEMSDLLICTQMAGRNDIAMLRDVLGNQMDSKDLRETMRTVTQLKKGQVFAFSPSKFGLLGVFNVPLAATFDSSRTPEVGDEAFVAKTKPLDIENLRESIHKAGEDLDVEDVEALHERIRELEHELKTRPAVTEIREEIREVPVLCDDDRKNIETLRNQLGALLLAFAPTDDGTLGNPYGSGRISTDRLEKVQQQINDVVASAERPTKRTSETGLRAGERRMLQTLAQFNPRTLTRTQLGALSGFTPTGGTFQTYISTLIRSGYVEKHGQSHLAITEAGQAFLGGDYPKTPRSLQDLVSVWRGTLRAGENKMLDVLLDVYPRALDRATLGERAGFEHKGGTFQTYLSTLRRNGLVAVRGSSIVASIAEML